MLSMEHVRCFERVFATPGPKPLYLQIFCRKVLLIDEVLGRRYDIYVIYEKLKQLQGGAHV